MYEFMFEIEAYTELGVYCSECEVGVGFSEHQARRDLWYRWRAEGFWLRSVKVRAKRNAK